MNTDSFKTLLMAGGIIANCLLFDAASFSQATWTPKANFGGSSREGAVGFSIGTKGYIGTGLEGPAWLFKQDFWEWDQASNAWTQKANFPGGLRSYAMGFSIGSKGYIGTGRNGNNPMFKDFWEWDQASNTWTQKGNFGGPARGWATGFSIGNKGYVGMGCDIWLPAYYNDFWEYDPATDTWTQKAACPGVVRALAAGFSIGAKGYIGTGLDGISVFNDFWEWDQSTNAWTQKANFGGSARGECSAFAIGNFGYMGTGTTQIASGTISDFWRYDASSNTWTQITSFGGGLREVSVGFSIGCHGYVGTGFINDNYNLTNNDFWELCDPGNPVSAVCCNSVLAIITAQSDPLCNSQCTGTATVTPTSGTSPYTYNWSNAQTTQTITGLCAGSYSATVTDATSSTAAVVVIIAQPPVLTATTAVTSSACSGNNGSATAAANGGAPGYTYNWDPSAQTSQTATGLAAGNHTVTVTDANGCTTTQTVTITSGSITATATSSTICSGQTATLTASGGNNYSWSNSQTTSSIAISPGATTTYTVLVTSGSCTAAATATVTVNSGLMVSAGNNVTVCTGTTVTLLASGGNTYSWNNGQTTPSITVNPTAVTTYTVIGTDANGCTGNNSVTVVVTPIIIADAGTDETICAGDNVPLNASGGTSYSWIPATGLSNPNIYNPIASPTTGATTYTVIVTSGSCASASDVVTIVTNPNPTASAFSNLTIMQGQSATLAASGGGTYLWSNGSTANPITVSPPVTTIYCVTVTQSNCTDTACVTVKVEPIDCGYADDQLFVPDAFSPNNDTKNDVLGVYYPNPSCIKEFVLIIYDRWGEKVLEADQITALWDGTYKGKLMNTAVFVYYMKVTFITGNETVRKGNISLLR
ncbi:MAG: T9SS type B sorting domain-containing protein [Bacteroidetes bacterium]|nr:MAG: T9SS type B sorting domain-containing protein [Bacteroidota bacterium]